MSDLTPADYPPYPRPESRSGGGTLALVFAIFTPLVALFLLGLAIVLWNKRSTKRAARRSANRASIPMTETVAEPPPAYVGVMELPGYRAKQEEGTGDAGGERLTLAR